MKRLSVYVLMMAISIILAACNFDNVSTQRVSKPLVTSVQPQLVLTSSVSANTNLKSSLKGKIVVIDPGHSATGNKGKEKLSPDSNTLKIKDPGGATGVKSRIPEYKVNMSIAQNLKVILEQQGVTVVMTKTKDSENPGNVERAEIGNNSHADLVIRIHADSATDARVHGASMLVPAPVGYAKDIANVSRSYGEQIQKELTSYVGMKNRGIVLRKDLTGFNWSKVPVVLAEVGFLSNPEEDAKLSTDSYQNKVAQGLGNGIIKVLSKLHT